MTFKASGPNAMPPMSLRAFIASGALRKEFWQRLRYRRGQSDSIGVSPEFQWRPASFPMRVSQKEKHPGRGALGCRFRATAGSVCPC